MFGAPAAAVMDEGRIFSLDRATSCRVPSSSSTVMALPTSTTVARSQLAASFSSCCARAADGRTHGTARHGGRERGAAADRPRAALARDRRRGARAAAAGGPRTLKK